MNSVVSQALCCLIHRKQNVRDWEILLPIVKMVIHSLPNQRTGLSPFLLNYGHKSVTPIQLLKGKEEAKTESVASFVQRVTSDWELARENLQRSIGLQQKYYEKKHSDVHYKEGDLMLLSTRNIKMKGIPGKLQKRFVGPFEITERIGQQAYTLSLPEDRNIHSLFHISLLKKEHCRPIGGSAKYSQIMYLKLMKHTPRLRRFYGGTR